MSGVLGDPAAGADRFRAPQLRADAEEIFRAAVDAVEPSRLVVRAFGALPTAIREALAVRRGRLVVLAAGKAAGAMAAALEDALADPRPPREPSQKPGLARLPPPPPPEGLVVVKRGGPRPKLRRLALIEAAHPLPDAAGLATAERMLALAGSLEARDLCFVLLSGGASALLPLPVKGVSLADLDATTDLLLRAGAAIEELNAVRKHLSRIAGGRLAAACGAGALIALAISDVRGDRLDTIASGPTVADETTFEQALESLRERALLEKVPASVRAHLEAGARGEEMETPKPGERALARARTIVIGSNRNALDAAAARAKERGYTPLLFPDALVGEARTMGEAFAARLLEARSGRGPVALIAGGETTVTVRGSGKGGRSQELALGAAPKLAGKMKACVLAAGTDGEDGPTDAAGAVVDGATIFEGGAQGMDPASALAKNDSYSYLRAVGGLVTTGPTGTNVMDVAIGLVG